MRKSTLTYIMLLSITSFYGCSDSQTDKTKTAEILPITPTAPKKESSPSPTKNCVYSPTIGNSVRWDLVDPGLITEASFGKPFNSSYIQAVKTSSLDDTMKLIKSSLELDVYRVNEFNKKSGCEHAGQALIQNLEFAPGHILDIWQDQNTNMDSKSVLIGLYLPKDHPQADLDRATIILSGSADRWAVIHETMHHLFDIALPIPFLRPHQVKLAISEIVERYIAKRKEISDLVRSDVFSQALLSGEFDKKIKASIDEAAQLVDHMDMLVLNYPLEEMAIESFLYTRAKSGELQYVEKENIRRSQGYAISSALMAMELFNSITKDLESYLDVIQELKDLDPYLDRESHQQSLKEVLKTPLKRFIEMSEVLAKMDINTSQQRNQEISMREQIQSLGHYLRPRRQNNHEPFLNFGCSHAQESLKIVKKLVHRLK